jgi:hypothetical protein
MLSFNEKIIFMNIQKLFPDSNYIEGIINYNGKDLYQEYSIKGSQKIYHVKIVCIVKLKNNTFSPVCLIDNDICILKNSTYILLNFFKKDIVSDFEAFCKSSKLYKKINDKSGMYVWIATIDLEKMRFIKIKSWVIVAGGFLKMTFKDDYNIERFIDTIEEKKIFCSKEVYDTITNLMDKKF